MKKILKSALSIVLCFAMFACYAPGAFAAALNTGTGYVNFDAAVIPDSVLGSDCFYIGSQNVTFSEKAQGHFLLKIARGGDAAEASDLTVKITDVTAKVGKNYDVEVYQDGTAPVVPDGYQSVAEGLTGDPDSVTEQPYGSEDELGEQLGDPDTAAALKTALTADDSAAAEEPAAAEGSSSQPSVYADDPLAQLRAQYTGAETDRQPMVSDAEAAGAALASNAVSDAVVVSSYGYTITMSFAAGEKEKYLSFTPKYSAAADGDMAFMLELQDCTVGVISALSSVNGTITDADAPQPITVGFAKTAVTADVSSGSVDVVIERSGSINNMAGVTMTSADGTAVSGKNYSKVNSDLYFPMGIYKRTVSIPIRNTGDEALTFTLRLAPMAGCEITDGTMTVTIPAEDSSSASLQSDGETAELQSGSVPLADYSFDLGSNDVGKMDGSYYNSDGYITMNFIGAPSFNNSERVDFRLYNGDRYAYDGVQIDWERIGEDGWWTGIVGWVVGSNGYGALLVNGSSSAVSHQSSFTLDRHTEQRYFGSLQTGSFSLYESYSSGRQWQTRIYSVTPIKRTFAVTIKDAAPLTFRGVSSEEAALYTSAQLENSAGATVKKLTGETVSVTANNSNHFARLVGLKVIDNNKKLSDWQFLTRDDNDTSTLMFTLTPEMLQSLAPYMTGTPSADPSAPNAVIGQLTIQPVFAYRDADLTVGASPCGSFTGMTAGAQTGWHLGDRITLKSTVSDSYKGKMVGTGFSRRTQLNSNAAFMEGSEKYLNGQFVYQLKDQTTTLTPAFSPTGNKVVVSVNKSLVDSGAFDKTKGIFLGSTPAVSGDNYEYTVVAPDKLNPNDCIPLTAVPAGSGTPVWTEPGSDAAYGGPMFAFREKYENDQNVITLSMSDAATELYSVRGTLYNADVNLGTGRTGDKPAFPANGAIVMAGGDTEAAGLDGSFELAPFRMIPGMSVRALYYNNGSLTTGDLLMPAAGAAKTSVSYGGKTYQAVVLDKGVIQLPSQAYNCAGFENLYVQQAGTVNNAGTTVALTGTETKFIAKVRDSVSYNLDGTEKFEKVTAVNFLIMDGATRKIKAALEAKQGEGDAADTWTASETVFSSCDRYTYGDVIYVQMSTDREVVAGSGVGTVYSPVATGYQIISGSQTDSSGLSVEVSIPVSSDDATAVDGSATLQGNGKGYMELPCIGYFNTLFQSEYFSLTVEKLADNAVRVRFGIGINALNPPENKDKVTKAAERDKKIIAEDVEDVSSSEDSYDEDGNLNTANTGTTRYKDYGLYGAKRFYGFDNANTQNSGGVMRLAEIVKGLSGKTSSSSKFKLLSGGDRGALNTQFGSPQIAVLIRVGGYFDFGIPKEGGFDFLGAGIYASADLYLGMNVYGVIWVVPVFIGASGDLSLSLDMRVINNTSDVKSDLYSNFFSQLWGALVRNLNVGATMKIEGTVGAGIAKMCAVRGYADFIIGFKYQPQLKEVYKDLTYSWGALVTADYGVAIDIMGLSLPFSLKGAAGENQDYWNLASFGMYKYFHDGVYNDTASLQSDGEGALQPQLEARAADAEWVGSGGAELQGAYKPVDTQTLMKNGYQNPASQIISLGNGKMLLVFLADDDEKADTEITSLQYSVYTPDVGWSIPRVIQNDKTGDYYPNVCDAGDSVMISWASAPDVTADAGSVDATKLAQSQKMEIYTTLFSKRSLTCVGEITRLTDDDFFDSQPVGVYDASSGDRIVYYVKGSNAVDSVTQMIDPTSTYYSVICYRLYDHSTGSWTTSYYDNEYSSGTDMSKYKGQRFLSSPIDGVEDPRIEDFAAAPGYNGIAVYAFTVDTDNDVTTVADRDLFVQVYDFSTHKTYKPIRITKDDGAAQTQPQLVRSGGSTYLFWLNGQKDVRYINVTELVRYGINPDGTMKKYDADTKAIVTENGATVYPYAPMQVEMNVGDVASSNLTTYKAVVDNNDNLYIVWPQHIKDDEKDAALLSDNGLLGNNYYQDLYATALIKDGTTGTEANPAPAPTWSLPYRLTRGSASAGYFYDGITGAADSGNNLMLAYNQFKQAFSSGDKTNPITVSDMKLQATKLVPSGSMTVSGVALSDVDPVGGKTISVEADVVNAGLTKASGYTAKFYEYRDGKKGSLIATKTGGAVGVNETDTVGFDWTLPADIAGLSLRCEVTETGYGDVGIFTTAPFTLVAAYDLDVTLLEQQGDDFIAGYTVTNTGSADSTDADVLNVKFNGPYGSYEQYGLSSDLLAQQSLAGIAPGEAKSFTTKLNIPASAFAGSGFIDCYMTIDRSKTDSDGGSYTDTLVNSGDMWLYMDAPMNLKVNGATSVSAGVNDAVSLQSTCDTNRMIEKVTDVKYSVADESIATLNGGTLTGVKAGTTTLTAYIEPYGITREIAVTVSGSADAGSGAAVSEPVTVTQTSGGNISLSGGKANTDGSLTYSITPSSGYEIADVLVNGKSVGAVSSYTFPSGTKSGTITATYRKVSGWTNPFADVKSGDWFFSAVQTVAQAGIMTGTASDRFSPDAGLTRGMFVTMLARYAQADTANTASAFTDVAAGAYYAGAVAWASRNGIVRGVSSVKFAPEQIITREQMTAMLCRYAAFAKLDVAAGGTTDISAYADAGQVSQYALTAVRWAVGESIIRGKTSTTLCPRDIVTRAQAAQMFANFIAFAQKS